MFIKAGPQIMGIINITPDSFSDGGDFLDAEKAVQQAEKMIQKGADILDIGGESTAPGNPKISAEKEWYRLQNIIPVLLKKNFSLSLDSQKAHTWEKFLALGGQMLNDVSGLSTESEEKILLLKKYPNSRLIIMFSRALDIPDPEDIMQEIKKFFAKKISLLKKAGIAKDRIILDPGMGGFISKNPKFSFEVLQNIKQLEIFGCKILVGTSRKSFLRDVSHPTDPKKRIIGSVVSALMAVQNGADIVRVHDVQEMKEAVQTVQATGE